MMPASQKPPPLHYTPPASPSTISEMRLATPKAAENATLSEAFAADNNANASTMSIISKPSVSPLTLTNKTIPKVVAKAEYYDTSFVTAGFGGDDDINDVAAMGGINLTEESQEILDSTEFVGTQIISVHDEILLHREPLQDKIKLIASNHGLEEPSSEVATLISHACQERLKTILEKLACIAEHRVDPIQQDSRYEPTQEVKGQLTFLEEVDRVEQKRHEEQDREELRRAAESASTSDLVRPKAKSKKMQRAEMVEMMQQETNMTALQAIGTRKKPRVDGPADTTDSPVAGGAGSSSMVGGRQLPLRPRLKRVNLRDLLFLLEQNRQLTNKNFLYKAFLK